MTDAPSLKSHSRKPPQHFRLPAWLSIVLACAAIAALVKWHWDGEGHGVTLVHGMAVTSAIVCFFAALSRRLLFASLAAGAIVIGIVNIALLKREVEGMVLHAWDIVQMFTSWSEYVGIIHEYWRPWAVCALTALAALVVLGLVARYERGSVRRVWACAAFAVSAGLVGWTAPRLPIREHTQYYWDGAFVSAFYRSFGETGEALLRGGLLERAGAGGPAFAAETVCRPQQRPPHILLIHEESVTPPSVFPGLKYDPALDPFFRSHDGKLHHLRVETYGGASWLTQFSVLAGVSSRTFGSMSNFVQPFMRGRLKETVSQVLARCGYRNMMFTAWPKQFMGVAQFYESIGIKEIFDQHAQGNERENERDRFFFNNALRQMQTHISASRQPLFLFIETMSAHWPYDVTYEPGVDVPGGEPGVHKEVHEYLRRLAMVKIDDDWLRAELARRFPGEAFLIVRYGDHHPHATRTLIGLPNEIEVHQVQLPDDSPGFTTFYAIDGIGYAPPPLPKHEIVDVAYLGALLLEASRLPMPASWRERLELMRACEGRYWTCADQERILSFQRRLLEAGLFRAR